MGYIGEKKKEEKGKEKSHNIFARMQIGQVTRLYNKVIAGPHTHTHTYSIHVFMRGLGILHNTLPVGKGALIELIIVLSVGYLLCVVLDRMMMVGPLQTAWRCGR